MKVIGFTGSRFGMSEYQRRQVLQHLARLVGIIGIHGDCIGADKEFHDMCVVAGMMTEAYPGHSAMNPRDTSLRAFCKANVIHSPMSHFKRNRAIVGRCSILLACPNSPLGIGGTWYTIGYAKKVGKEHLVLHRTPEEEDKL